MPERGRRPPTRQVHCVSHCIYVFCISVFLTQQAYLEEIKEIKEEEAKRKGEEVKTKAEETIDEIKAEESAEESQGKDPILLESSEAKEIILETTFEDPSPTEIQQIVKNESKPLAEKKED